jgi:hypothetical protein
MGERRGRRAGRGEESITKIQAFSRSAVLLIQKGIARAVTTHPESGAMFFFLQSFVVPRQTGCKAAKGTATFLSCSGADRERLRNTSQATSCLRSALDFLQALLAWLDAVAQRYARSPARGTGQPPFHANP